MQKLETAIPGVFELRPKVIRDARGFFMETYQKARFPDLGITDIFLHDNHSRSEKGTLRGASLPAATSPSETLPSGTRRSPRRRGGHSRWVALLRQMGQRVAVR